jgi:hypothetical protein
MIHELSKASLNKPKSNNQKWDGGADSVTFPLFLLSLARNQISPNFQASLSL